jgi:transmembrane sensor
MSTIKQFPNTEVIKIEAADWVVRVYGQTYKTDQEIEEEVLAELEVWMSQSPLHRETFFKTLGSWDAIGMLGELAEIMPLSELQRKNTFGVDLRDWFDRGASFINSRWGLAFSGAVTASLALLVWMSLLVVHKPVEFVTGVGEQKNYTLSDGSVLSLNTNSKVTADFSGDRRVIRLEKGEANFKVAKDSDWPFVVYAGDGMVWAVGTAFNVNNRGDHVDVIVSEGTVKVFSGVTAGDDTPLLATGVKEIFSNPDEEPLMQSKVSREVLLDAGETAQYTRQNIVKEPIEAQRFMQELAWQEGSLVFRGETLEEALAEISRYTDKPLVIVDESIRNASVGGRYKVNDIDGLIESLTLGLGIKTKYSDDGGVLFFTN